MKIYKISAKGVPKECTGGDCYIISGKYVMDHAFMGDANDLFLVHGIVTGQGKIQGIEYDHAWVEKGDNVLDMSCGRNIEMPKQVYYALGNIKRIIKYTPDEMRKKINQYKHWGPWDL
jgi:hypothetical protein